MSIFVMEKKKHPHTPTRTYIHTHSQKKKWKKKTKTNKTKKNKNKQYCKHGNLESLKAYSLKLRALSKFSSFGLKAYFHRSPLKNHISPKELGCNHFSMKRRAILTENLKHETLLNIVVYGSNETHFVMHNLKM